MGDVVEFIRTAKDRGMRVIADFVINHTSDRHPWFKESRKSVDNPYRDYYVWRKDTPPDTSEQVVFPGEETSIWTQDKATGEWYLHMFAKHQPDLNVANPKVRDEIAKSMGFWLQMGLDGFRLDAVPFFLELQGVSKEDAGKIDPHDYLAALRSFINRRNGSAILLGEVNLPYKDQLKYFGGPDGNELNMQFDFLSMQNIYLSLAREDARPLAKTLAGRPAIHPDNQWAMFVRNHDELTLDKLSDEEKAEVFAAFGPDPDMQMYGRGLRRRLPPMLDGDPARIRMVYSLMFSLPGTPVLFYGEEIGMGEDLRAKGRSAVRSPMQWNDTENGGFSTAPADQLVAQVVDGYFGPKNINAARAKRDPDSLWNFIAALIRSYRESPGAQLGRLRTHQAAQSGRAPAQLHPRRFNAGPGPQHGRTAGLRHRKGFVAGRSGGDVRRSHPAGPARRRKHRAGGRRRIRAGAGTLRLPLVPDPAAGGPPDLTPPRWAAVSLTAANPRKPPPTYFKPFNKSY